LVFAFILLAHVGFFWMLNSGLVSGSQIVDRIFEVVDIQDPAPEQTATEPPPPPPKRIELDMAQVEEPVLVLADIVTPRSESEITVARVIPNEPPLIAAPVKKIVLPMSNPRRPLSQPPYPAASQRLGEEGKVILELYVLEDGRVGDATIIKSSGYPRLDQAAVEEAKRAWRLLPGTEDGRPKAMQHKLTVTFRIDQ
jgi:protein TonB